MLHSLEKGGEKLERERTNFNLKKDILEQILLLMKI